jgi:hypothetical protein
VRLLRRGDSMCAFCAIGKEFWGVLPCGVGWSGLESDRTRGFT